MDLHERTLSTLLGEKAFGILQEKSTEMEWAKGLLRQIEERHSEANLMQVPLMLGGAREVPPLVQGTLLEACRT